MDIKFDSAVTVTASIPMEVQSARARIIGVSITIPPDEFQLPTTINVEWVVYVTDPNTGADHIYRRDSLMISGEAAYIILKKDITGSLEEVLTEAIYAHLKATSKLPEGKVEASAAAIEAVIASVK